MNERAHQTVAIDDGRKRAAIENVRPSVDAGRFPAKRIVGDSIDVEADCFADGHDVLAARVLWRAIDASDWCEASMAPIGNDRWRGTFTADQVGVYEFTVTAWVDTFLSWRHDFSRRVEAEDISSAAATGAELIGAASLRSSGDDRKRLTDWATRLRAAKDIDQIRVIALDAELGEIAARHADRQFSSLYAPALRLVVDRDRARHGAWYEIFPRSTSPEQGCHGTFKDLEARLPYIEKMGFDVLYLPPIHPIGRERRKGPNNTLNASAQDVGSPWAIGAAEGGHKSILPALGTLDDFRHLVAAAARHHLEIALDIAFQCAPDHPYVSEHPQWFRKRSDGTIQYAENPPKKYQDIFPFDFESSDWLALWTELKSVLEFWIAQGVKIFRVDNPHTKALPFWEWVIGEVKRSYPETIFLSEAFTRPKVMHRLAKIGFSQSYTYFAWRNTKSELIDYFTELTRGDGRDYLRPNVWPNTPDILTEYLQFGGRPAFMVRLVLAATLVASYGIYGPAFELCESDPRDPGGEEYLNSEKYQLRHWDIERADSLAGFIGRVNRIRHENRALQEDGGLAFPTIDNDQLLCYSRVSADESNTMLMVVNLDPYHPQSGWVDLDLDALGVEPATPYQVHELLTGARYLWNGARNFVSLDPSRSPAHIFRVRRRIRTERDFDYFL
jgi:starch synthase (maltosyl-transferring)